MSYVAPTKVFSHLDRLAAWKRGDRPAPGPVTVEIDLSNVCSLGCQSCHFAHTHVAGPWASTAAKPTGYGSTGRFLDPDLLMRAMDEMRVAGVRGLVFSGGGEPTLHPEFDRLVSAGRHFDLGMYTLGGHLTTKTGRPQIVGNLFSWVVISLDAPDAETYAREKRVPAERFEAACAGVRAVAAEDCVVGVSFLLHAGNWRRTADMLALGRSLGASYVTFRPTIETDHADLSVIAGDRGWVTEALPTLTALHAESDVEIDPDRFVEYRDWSGRDYAVCHGIKLVTQITPDGRVWVCPNRRGIAGSELGDLNTESFASIWARHPGQWEDFRQCRAMCRLHLVNRQLSPAFQAQQHEAFV